MDDGKIDRQALDMVEADLEAGNELTFSHVGAVFGTRFWILLVASLMDASDAARAIQGAINRLRKGEKVEGEEDQ